MTGRGKYSIGQKIKVAEEYLRGETMRSGFGRGVFLCEKKPICGKMKY